jgi:multiple antibiotic resistance protein
VIDLLATFIVFFAVIDPIGTVPIFIAVTKSYDDASKRKIALIAICVSAAILIFFVVAGELILTALGIPLSAFQIAGGIVLFLFALSMIFGESKPEEELKLIKNHHDTAVFPLAVPSIAGPGAMLTVVLLTDGSRFNLWEQFQTVAVMLSVLLLVYVLMLGSNYINKLIGSGGASVVSRVMGLILAAVATTNTLEGVKLYFGLS